MSGDAEVDPILRNYANTSMDTVDTLELDGGTVSIFAAACPGREGPNQDSALVAELSSQELVLCVADGVGGHRDGAVASRIAIEAIADALVAGRNGVRDAILDGFDLAHKNIGARGVGAATTLAGVHILGDELRSFHVGDSQALVMGQRGRRKLLTPPHSPVGYALESGLIDEAQAIMHEGLHIVSNLVGVEDARIELSSAIRLSPRDTVVVATDGLFDNMLADEVIEAVRKGPQGEATASLVDAVRCRMAEFVEGQPGKPDDLAVIVYRPPARRG